MKILNPGGSVLLSSPFASGSSTAWHGIEHYNIAIPQNAPCSGDPSGFLLLPQHLLGQPHVLSTPQHTHFLISLPPLSNLPNATPLPSAPWAPVSTAFPLPMQILTICPSPTQISLFH